MKTTTIARIASIWIALLTSCLLFGGEAKVATSQEESRMLGMFLSALQDAEGGYTRKGLAKYKVVNRELEKREYSQKLRWQVHHWYGKALLDAGKKKDAIGMLQIAQKDAESLTAKEQQDTKELLDRAQAK